MNIETHWTVRQGDELLVDASDDSPREADSSSDELEGSIQIGQVVHPQLRSDEQQNENDEQGIRSKEQAEQTDDDFHNVQSGDESPLEIDHVIEEPVPVVQTKSDNEPVLVDLLTDAPSINLPPPQSLQIIPQDVIQEVSSNFNPSNAPTRNPAKDPSSASQTSTLKPTTSKPSTSKPMTK